MKLINRLLKKIKEQILNNEEAVEYLDLLDDETLPQNRAMLYLFLGNMKQP